MSGENVQISSNGMSSRVKRQYTMCLTTFFVNGALALSIGTLLPYVRDTYGLAYAFAGMLVSLHSIGNLISSFFSGILAIRLGWRATILIFEAFPIIAFILLATTQSPVLLVFAFLATGLGRGAISNFNNSMMNAVLPSRAWALNTLHASFSVGAFLSPFIAITCAQSFLGWQLTCWILTALAILSFAIFAIIPIEKQESKTADLPKPKADFGFVREKVFWCATATFFFYLCTEQGMIGWLVTYFQDSGLLPTTIAQTMSSVLWILILAGRLVAAYLSTRVARTRLLGIMGIGFLGFFFVLIFARSLPLIIIGLSGFGFSMAGIYPTNVSLTGELMRKYPLSWSFMLTMGSLGSILMPSIIGAVADSAGIIAGMGTLFVSITLCVASIICSIIVHTKNSKSAN